jgi:hypothetical protein
LKKEDKLNNVISSFTFDSLIKVSYYGTVDGTPITSAVSFLTHFTYNKGAKPYG